MAIGGRFWASPTTHGMGARAGATNGGGAACHKWRSKPLLGADHEGPPETKISVERVVIHVGWR